VEEKKLKKASVRSHEGDDLIRLLGTNLRRLRTQRKLTQDELAERCEISPRMVREMELANRAPSFPNLARLCRGLAVQAFEFFLPVEGGEKFSKRQLLGRLRGDILRDLEKRFNQYIE
jgi:transcriptional regulator with XRE-family HTH domain